MSNAQCPFCRYASRKDHVARHIRAKHDVDYMPIVEHITPTLVICQRENGDCFGFCLECYRQPKSEYTGLSMVRRDAKAHYCRIKKAGASEPTETEEPQADAETIETATTNITNVPANVMTQVTPATRKPIVDVLAMLAADDVCRKLIMDPEDCDIADDERSPLERLKDRLRSIPKYERSLRQHCERADKAEKELGFRVEQVRQDFDRAKMEMTRDNLSLQQAAVSAAKREQFLEDELRKMRHNVQVMTERLAKAQADATVAANINIGFARAQAAALDAAKAQPATAFAYTPDPEPTTSSAVTESPAAPVVTTPSTKPYYDRVVMAMPTGGRRL